MSVEKVKISNSIIINRDLPHEAFGVYVILKSLAKENIVRIRMKELREKTRFPNQRRLKKHLNVLHKFKLIKKIPRINPHMPTKIELIDYKEFRTEYAEIGLDTIEDVMNACRGVRLSDGRIVKDSWYIGLRLFYYYKKNLNKVAGVAYPSFEQIEEDIRISSSYCGGLNKALEENDLIVIIHGEWYEEKTEKWEDRKKIRKTRNNYKLLKD